MVNTNNPEMFYYILYKYNITEIIVTQNELTIIELQNPFFNTILKTLPVILRNGYATVYSIPRYNIKEKANQILLFSNYSPQNLFYNRENITIISTDNVVAVGGDYNFKIENDQIKIGFNQ